MSWKYKNANISRIYGDLQWWNDFLETFNGKCDFLDDYPVTTLCTDASTNGVGAWFEENWFYSYLPVDFPWSTHLHINYKEAICVVLAALYWAPYWRNKFVVVWCDNTAAVAMLNKGSIKHPVMMVFLRMLFWLSATYNFRLKAYHIPGVANVEADHVSRLHERSHFCAFYNILAAYSQPWNTFALSHMSLGSYLFLLGKYLIS